MSPEVELEVTGVAAGGDGIAREPEGRVVFVRGAIPGERVVARLLDQRRDYARAELVRVLVASGDRVEPPCRFVPAGCGGCGWQHIAPAAQARLKRDVVADALRRIARIGDPPVADTVVLPAERYRTTVRVAVDARGRPAFRKHNSHELVAIDDCLVAHPDVAIQLRSTAFAPGARDVTLRGGGDVVAGRRFRVSRNSFFQVRPDGAAVLVDLVAAALAGHGLRRFVDLYAGVGLFAGTLHDRGFDAAVAVEGNAAAIADAAVNLAGVCEVVHADVTRWPGVPAEAVVADPSRDGLGRGGVDAVLRCDPTLVVLVSCDAAALGRDARLLGERGYGLEIATPVDLFVHTPHVEVVSAFVRL